MNPLSIVSHSFSGGLYCKRMKVQAGHFIVQHKHKYDHLSVLVSGLAIVTVDGIGKKYSGTEISVDGEDLLIMRESDVLAVI